MLSELLGTIERARWYRGQLVHVSSIPGRPSRNEDVDLPAELQAGLDRQGIRLYVHQAESLRSLRAGHDLILTTPTASGKTLAFNLPIVEGLLKDPSATALYLYPLKALANDQKAKLEEIAAVCNADLRPSTYDGDTPIHARRSIRQTARIILSNPHALHQYLPWHGQWARFLAGLRYVVLDEVHQYRGIAGANVAALIRRLVRIAAYYGSNPQFVLSSASIANPEAFARSLLGRDVISVADDGSSQGPRSVLFWDPMADPATSVTRQAARLLSLLVSRGLPTICFTRSRATAERLARAAQRDCPDQSIEAYRAGYLAVERRNLERRLRDGQISGIVSTTALESGIDIGGLDASMLVGFPGSLLAAWQQAGRAGRSDRPSVVVYIPYENPLDRFFLRHPHRFVDGVREHLVLPRTPERQRAGHLACAAAELPLQAVEVDPADQSILEHLIEAGLLAATPSGYVYRGLRRAHEAFPIEEMQSQAIRLVCEGETLETMDTLRACRDAYPGALLLHQGETLRVTQLDLEAGVAHARREETDAHTHGLRLSQVEILDVTDRRTAGIATLQHGRVRVTETFVGFKQVDSDGTVTTAPLELPPYVFETDGLWASIQTPPRTSDTADLLAALHGAEHALIAMVPLLIVCEASDVGGVSTTSHPQTTVPTILLFDSIGGGAGIAPILFSSWQQLVTSARSLVEHCPCDAGCPSCVLSPRCGSQNQPLSKTGAWRILDLLSDDTVSLEPNR